MFASGDVFTVNDISSSYHEWEGIVLTVDDGEYFSQLTKWTGTRVSITFLVVAEQQMASNVYLDDLSERGE